MISDELFIFAAPRVWLIKPPSDSIFFTCSCNDLNAHVQNSLQKEKKNNQLGSGVLTISDLQVSRLLHKYIVYYHRYRYMLVFLRRIATRKVHTEGFLQLISLQPSSKEPSSIQLSQTSKEWLANTNSVFLLIC